MAGQLEGKTALVTGGASGIGLSTVRRFIAEGANVVICDLSPQQGRNLVDKLGDAAKLHHSRRAEGGPNDGNAIATELGDRACFIGTDVTDEESLRNAFQLAVDRFGGLDILVNNAGIGGGEGPIETCPRSFFDRTIAVNLLGPWLGIKLAFPLLRVRGGGSIVSTSSISALVGMPGQGAYGASKAGVLQLTRVAAMEGAADFIRVNAVCPGGVVTPIIYDSPFSEKAIDPHLIDRGLSTAQPLPRACKPEDVANAILWLASDQSSFVTGQTVTVDGGLTVEFSAQHRRQPVTS
jgi:NAD(P)-dependent dehydrogenase (short-subunit alcohol dehydrogenase family)